MTVTYPLNLPDISAAQAVMALEYVNSETVSPYTREAPTPYPWPGQQWVFDVTLPPMPREDAVDWIVFGGELRGRLGTFLAGIPGFATPRGAGGGTPVVNGAGQDGNDSLVVSGFPNSVTGVVKKGDAVQVGTGLSSRLYVARADVNSDSSGNATIPVMPDVRVNTANGAAITLTNARGLFRMVDDSLPWRAEPGVNFYISFQAKEVI